MFSAQVRASRQPITKILWHVDCTIIGVGRRLGRKSKELLHIFFGTKLTGEIESFCQLTKAGKWPNASHETGTSTPDAFTARGGQRWAAAAVV
jgi:hypothetical protein